MNKPDGIFPDDANKEINFIDLNQPIKVLLASSSKFFLEGINKAFRNEKGAKILGVAQNQEEIEKGLERMKPDILFIDNRAQKFDVHKILPLNNSSIKVILLGDSSAGEPDLPNVTYLTRHASSSELIWAMRKSLHKSMAINIEEYKPSTLSRLDPGGLDQPETIIELTEVVYYEEKNDEAGVKDEIKLFDDELTFEERITHADQEFESPGPFGDHQEKRDGRSRIAAVSQVSLLLLLTVGVVYLGTKYTDMFSDLRGFITDSLVAQTDSKIKLDISTALSEQGFGDINVSIAGGKAVLNGKVQSYEDYRKAGSITGETKGVKGVENRLVVEKTITDSEVILDVEEIVPPQHRKSEEAEEENDGRVSRLNAGGKEMGEKPAAEKKAADFEPVPDMDEIEPTHHGMSKEPEEKNGREVPYPNRKNVAIDRSSVEKEAKESRRFQVLAEMKNEVRRKEIIEVIRTNYEKPMEPESDARVSALPSTRDASIARDIERALASEGYENIRVYVNDGAVFITGEVETHLDHLLLNRIALKTSGVKRVKSVLGISEYSAMP